MIRLSDSHSSSETQWRKFTRGRESAPGVLHWNDQVHEYVWIFYHIFKLKYLGNYDKYLKMENDVFNLTWSTAWSIKIKNKV